MPTWLPALTIDGLACRLVLPEANWRVRPRITHRYETDMTEGRTGIEGRASSHPELRLTLEYSFTLAKAIAAEFHATLLALPTDARLALPLWPDKHSAADYAAAKRIYSPQHWINFDAVTAAYTIDAGGGHPESVGLAVCSLLERPRFTPKTDLEATVVIRAEEDSPWESRVELNTLAQATWNFDPDWKTLPEDNSRWQLKREKLGRGRVSARSGQLGATKHGQAASFTLRGIDTIRRALTFWAGHCGPRDPFTVPIYFRPDWDGTEGDVPVMQARFAEETLALDFGDQPDVARTRLGFSQDLLLVGGQPSQSRPSRALLVKAWWYGSANLFAWTDWPVAYTHAGVTYEPTPIDLKAMNETLRPGQSEWQFLVTDFDGNPLRAFGRLARERPLMVEVRECDPAIANTAALIFSGEIKKAPNKGPLYTVTLALFGGVLRYLTPDCNCQQGCNNTLGDQLCGKDIETLKATGTIAAIAGTVIDVTTADAGGADAWALGYALLGTGDTQEVRFIVRSEAIAGGQRVTFERPLWGVVVGADVVLYPGCDQQYEGGCARWNNQRKYFGAPWKPTYLETVATGFRAKTGK